MIVLACEKTSRMGSRIGPKDCWIFATLLFGAVHANAAPTGAVRLCRDQALMDAVQKRFNNADIRLPTRLLLDDFGRQDGSGSSVGHKWPLAIITLKPVEILPNVRCVVVPATISPLSKVLTVVPSDHRNLEIVGVTTGDGYEDPTAAPIPEGFEHIHVTVAREFK